MITSSVMDKSTGDSSGGVDLWRGASVVSSLALLSFCPIFLFEAEVFSKVKKMK